VYHGIVPHCTACGAIRAPLSGPSVNLAGKSSQVGGAIVRAAGGAVIVGGSLLALALGGLLYVLAPLAAAVAVSLPIAALALAIGLALLLGGQRLRRSGNQEERATRQRALLALTEARGNVSALEAARVLGLTESDADRLLTDLAKREPERMAVDVDREGTVRYRSPSGPVPENVRISADSDEASNDDLHADDDAEWRERLRR
jgi:hypothetical protein